MPLSRLTPRSSRKGLARQRPSSRQKSDSQRHLQLWAAIRKTREELDLWQRQINQVESLFNEHIVPREYSLTEAMSDLTERLIEHFSTTDLDIPNQSLLGLWINENLNSLQDHPFGNEQITRSLSRQWLELLNNDGPVETQLARLVRKHTVPSTSDDDGAEERESHSISKAELSGSTGQTSEHHPTATDDEPEKINRRKETKATGADKNRERTGSESGDNDTREKLHSLENRLSVERLFRQLAKVLHPDREQHEARRAEKHELMSQCLKARKDKDINALLSLYCEHVGELPDDLNNNSHSELVDALETQLKALQAELRQKRFGDPLQSMIVERYSSSDSVDSERRIQSHAQSLDVETASARRLIAQMKNKDSLLDALDERRSVEQDRMSINELTGFAD